MSENKELSIDVDYVEDKIHRILLRQHNHSAQHKIKRFPNENRPDRLNFACPVCGDSQKSVYKKRGNLYLKNMMYVCFNDCEKPISFLRLCDTFDEKIGLDERMKLYDYIDSNMTYSKGNDYALTALDKLLDINEWITYMNEKENSWLVDIKQIQVDSKVYNYLKFERNIVEFECLLQGTYRVIRDGKVVFWSDVLINVNKGSDRLLGIQLRNLEQDKSKRFYKIVEFDELYNYINEEDPIDPLEAVMYNKLSHFYNILNVNFDKTVTVFEGFLDSLFYPNSVGLVGANNDNDILNFLTEADDGIDLRFFYDNDKKGQEKSVSMMKKGFKVFIWNKLFSALLSKSKDPQKFRNTLNAITDLNELAIVSKQRNVFKLMKLKTFFSNDVFDTMFIDKPEKFKKTTFERNNDFDRLSNISFDSLRKINQ